MRGVCADRARMASRLYSIDRSSVVVAAKGLMRCGLADAFSRAACGCRLILRMNVRAIQAESIETFAAYETSLCRDLNSIVVTRWQCPCQ